MRMSEWVVLVVAAFFLLLSALIDPMLTVGLAIVLLVGFSIMHIVQLHNQQL